ncbi:unnamed protein product [Cuscuta campestris]|nr:unnamed protein product [Cuscuta campestris]
MLAEYVALMGDMLQALKDVALRGKGSLDDEPVIQILARIGKPQTGEKREVHASERETTEEWEKKNEMTWTKLHRSLEKRVKNGVDVMRKAFCNGSQVSLGANAGLLPSLWLQQRGF